MRLWRIFYPRRWLLRFGAEFEAMLADQPAGASFLDLIRGATAAWAWELREVRSQNAGFGRSVALIGPTSAFLVAAQVRNDDVLGLLGSTLMCLTIWLVMDDVRDNWAPGPPRPRPLYRTLTSTIVLVFVGRWLRAPYMELAAVAYGCAYVVRAVRRRLASPVA